MGRLHGCALALMLLGPAAVAAPAQFALPAPGAYKLERILKAPDGIVLDSDGSRHRLSEFTTGKVTLFSFIYTYCTDAKGCPLAYETLHTLKKTLGKDARTRDQVRFVSMSFDPTYDTPPAMRSYGGLDARERGGVDWRFLTSRSNAELAPMLDGFGQDVSVAAERAPGQRVPTLSHLLKVYLIDASGTVREIYSTSFLQSDVVLNDIRTLLLEAQRKR
ncbi:SCO family protein [Massilia atriviolacea]|uniref:SCO family protein n=1 Tax=Massilia atriviolacea TaxID=2495579 RepID=A0A430HQQ7_9BURK|nr:SCO family protein [Massilia atriviolacea]RSZ59856.1 SCO family protein [Massilia atriviolacea]